MEERKNIPYFKLPTLNPEGNAIETLYGREQRRNISASYGAFAIPASQVGVFDIFLCQYGPLIKENQILIGYEPVIALNALTSNDKSLTILTASLELAMPNGVPITTLGSVFWASQLQPPFTGTPTLVNVSLFKGYIPPFRWDDYAEQIIKGYKFKDSWLWLHIVVQNNDAVNPHSFSGTFNMLYDVKQLEFS